MASTEGQDETEFRRLGMCEACRHILEDPLISVYVKWTQCASLTYSGLQMAERLVILSQVRGPTHGDAAQRHGARVDRTA